MQDHPSQETKTPHNLSALENEHVPYPLFNPFLVTLQGPIKCHFLWEALPGSSQRGFLPSRSCNTFTALHLLITCLPPTDCTAKVRPCPHPVTPAHALDPAQNRASTNVYSMNEHGPTTPRNHITTC